MKIGAKIFLGEYHMIDELAREYDFLEIYFRHNVKVQMEKWPMHIKWVLHVPHSAEGVNLSVEKDNNMDYVKKSLEFGGAIGAKMAVIHPGWGGSKEILTKNMKEAFLFAKKLGIKLLIENIPVTGEKGIRTIKGPDEYKELMKATGCGLCLDFSHAVHTGFYFGVPYKDMINEFMKLKPDYFHLYDTNTQQSDDIHLGFGEGNFDIDFALSLVKNKMVTFELPQNNQLQHYLNAKKYLVKRGFYP